MPHEGVVGAKTPSTLKALSLYKQHKRDYATTEDLRFIKVIKGADNFLTKIAPSKFLR